jgi:hypothetical protein
MGFVADGTSKGGCVITSTDGTLVHHSKVDDKTLDKVAALLGISKSKRKQLISKTRCIHIHRGAPARGAKRRGAKKKK